MYIQMQKMNSLNDEQLLEATGKPDVGYLQNVYQETQSDLSEWLEQRQDDYETRRCIWEGKSNDFRKHSKDSETGGVFPFDGASDHEIYEVDDLVNSHKSMCMNAIRRAQLTAMPTEATDTENSSVISNFMRWLMNVKMGEFYSEMELGIDNLLEKGLMVHYVFWDSMDRKTQREITLEEITQMLGGNIDPFMSGQMDEQLAMMLSEGASVSKKKAQAMIDQLRIEGKTTIPVTVKSRNQPCIRALPPDEDFFLPAWTIDPQKAPYAFHVIAMTPEEIKAKGESEEWDKEFIEAACEIEGFSSDDPSELYRSEESFLLNNTIDKTIRVVYCYQRLLDEDNIPGIYCTIFVPGVPDLYGKHFLLDYAHGEYPFVVTPLERTSKRLYASRSYPERAASSQKIIKSETDASIDNLSLSTMPPLLHPPGQRPTKWGPGVQLSVFRPDQYRYAATPALPSSGFNIREETRMMMNKYFGRQDTKADSIEIQTKQQDLVNRVLSHVKSVLDQVYTLYQQFGPDEEFFRVVGVQDYQRYTKGTPGSRYDFWIDFDITTQDPTKMIERATAVADLYARMGKGTELDSGFLLQLIVGSLMPGMADRVNVPVEQATEKAMAEERAAIAELSAGVQPNVRENDAHEAKSQIFQQWLQQPDIQQKLSQDEAFRGRVENHYKQRNFQIQQKQNAQIGRQGAAPTQFGQTAQMQ